MECVLFALDAKEIPSRQPHNQTSMSSDISGAFGVWTNLNPLSSMRKPLHLTLYLVQRRVTDYCLFVCLNMLVLWFGLACICEQENVRPCDTEFKTSKRYCPGWVAQMVGVLSHAPKGCRFLSQSQHIPRFQVQSPVGVQPGSN